MKLEPNKLPKQLFDFLIKKKDWVAKGDITRIVWKNKKDGKNFGKTYLPETVGRSLRSLEKNSFIAVKDDGESVQYKYIPKQYRDRYIPTSQRTDEKLFTVA